MNTRRRRPIRILLLTLVSTCAVALSLRCRARSASGEAVTTIASKPAVRSQANVPAFEQGNFPELSIGNNFGVNIHGASPRDFDSIADAGFKFVRIDLNWQSVEQSPEKYEWATYQRMAEQLRARNLRPLFILSYSNSIYAPEVEVKHGPRAVRKPAAPTVRLARAAFASWAAEAARVFAPDEPVFEIWNEPDLDAFWPPRSNAAEYVALAGGACQAIRQANPRAIVVGPGAAKPPTPSTPNPAFLSAVLASELATCLDGISVHPYLHISELPNAGRNWQLLRTLIASSTKERSNRRPLVPLSSESGLSTGGGSLLHKPPDESTQAFYAVRMLLHNFESGIPISIWYDWKDDGEDPSDAENRFGLVRRDLSPKPAYVAVRTMIRELRSSHLSCSTHEASGQTLLVFGGSDAEVKLAIWNHAGAGVRLRLAVPAPVQRVVDMYGNPIACEVPGGTFQCDTFGTVYVTLQARDAARFCADLERQPQP